MKASIKAYTLAERLAALGMLQRDINAGRRPMEPEAYITLVRRSVRGGVAKPAPQPRKG